MIRDSRGVRLMQALLICSVLLIAGARTARAASAALWIADPNNNTVNEFLPSQIKASGSPIPITINLSSGSPFGVCFDKSHNLWVTTSGPAQVLEFTAAALKKLPHQPIPAVTITSSSFSDPVGCNFDRHGNMWIADWGNSDLYEITAKQLKTGTGAITPPVVILITDQKQPTPTNAYPGFVTFDKSGNLWIDGRDTNQLQEFSGALTSTSVPKVILSGGGSLRDPGQIGFDGHGNAWVTSYSDDTVVMFARKQLGHSNNDPPSVTLSSSTLIGPWGLFFRGGPLWILNYSDGNAQEFLPSQIKTSGSPAPKIFVTGAAHKYNMQITFGPAFGILE